MSSRVKGEIHVPDRPKMAQFDVDAGYDRGTEVAVFLPANIPIIVTDGASQLRNYPPSTIASLVLFQHISMYTCSRCSR